MAWKVDRRSAEIRIDLKCWRRWIEDHLERAVTLSKIHLTHYFWLYRIFCEAPVMMVNGAPHYWLIVVCRSFADRNVFVGCAQTDCVFISFAYGYGFSQLDVNLSSWILHEVAGYDAFPLFIHLHWLVSWTNVHTENACCFLMLNVYSLARTEADNEIMHIIHSTT